MASGQSAASLSSVCVCKSGTLLPIIDSPEQVKSTIEEEDVFNVQSDMSMGLHSPRCFISSVPAQRLAPLTSLANSE